MRDIGGVLWLPPYKLALWWPSILVLFFLTPCTPRDHGCYIWLQGISLVIDLVVGSSPCFFSPHFPLASSRSGRYLHYLFTHLHTTLLCLFYVGSSHQSYYHQMYLFSFYHLYWDILHTVDLNIFNSFLHKIVLNTPLTMFRRCMSALDWVAVGCHSSQEWWPRWAPSCQYRTSNIYSLWHMPVFYMETIVFPTYIMCLLLKSGTNHEMHQAN